MSAERLRITEVFHSIQGEATDSGWPTVFIRLTGCPLRCTYCDTAYAFSGGAWQTVDELLDQVATHATRHVCVTGGEPLAQTRCHELLQRLCEAHYVVSLETSGAIDISSVDQRVRRIVDIKTPASGEVDRNLLSNLQCLTPADALKFVICDRSDYDWARQFLAEHSDIPCTTYFSPSHAQLAPGTLADWLLEDRLNVRLQVQLHKVLWGDVAGR